MLLKSEILFPYSHPQDSKFKIKKEFEKGKRNQGGLKRSNLWSKSSKSKRKSSQDGKGSKKQSKEDSKACFDVCPNWVPHSPWTSHMGALNYGTKSEFFENLSLKQSWKIFGGASLEKTCTSRHYTKQRIF